WQRMLRADPLARLNLGGVEDDLRQLMDSSLPATTPAQRERVEVAVRRVTSAAGHGLPDAWAEAVREAATEPGTDLSGALDHAVSGVDLRLHPPGWWRVVRLLHVVLAVLAVTAFLWLSLIGIVDWTGLPSISPPFIGPLALPTLLLGLGVVGGVMLAVVSRLLVRRGAEQRRSEVAAQLRSAIAGAADERVLAPVAAVLADHRAAREALSRV
ncbi:MAG TPA: ABC transporter, partial [Actinomycetes bacterium]|nr:ABC transporter [Actinomycetes bacterium]